jgi:hypothetical protein
MFGFSLSRDHADNGFRLLFGKAQGENPEWLQISREHMLRSLDWEMCTQGETLARAENKLVVALVHKKHVAGEIDRLSDGFYRALSDGGIEAAAEYAEREFMAGMEGGGTADTIDSGGTGQGK